MRPTSDVQSWLRRGLLAGQNGDYGEACRCFQAARDLDPDNIVALLWLAWLAPSRRESLALFCRVLELDPYNKQAQAGIDWVRSRPRSNQLLRQTDSIVEEAALDQPSQKPVASRPGQGQIWTAVAAVLGRRLAFGALVLVTIIFLTHLGFALARGLTLYTAASSCRPMSGSCQVTLAEVLTFFPALTSSVSKTFSTLARLAHGDLGLTRPGTLTLRSIPVTEVIAPALSKSLGLLAASLLLATLLGVILGLLAAGRRHSGWALPILLTSIAGISVPSFFAALILHWIIVRWTRSFGQPLLPLVGFGWDLHIILPALVLAARPVAQITRVTFVSVGDILDHDFIRTAHGKGLKPRHVMNRHVIRNAAIPILTVVGLSLRFSLSSLPVVEYLFRWPGIGFTLLKSISHQDENLTVALLLCLGIIFILVNLILEGSYRLVDPRLREPPAFVRRGERGSLTETAQSLLASLREMIVHNPLNQWLKRRRAGSIPSPFRTVLDRNQIEAGTADYGAERRRAWFQGTLGNLPFFAGGILVATLILVFAFGPRLAPHSPYTTQGLVYEAGEFRVPPFAPDKTHLWGTDVLGRDIMSLILVGAQQTLLLAALVVLARFVVGFLLGVLAGWLQGSWVDRSLLTAAEIIAAFPTLLLAMMLILALDIRQGLRPFVIGLCFVGWGEIMQFVRGEVLTIRAQPFIESAAAVGLRTPRIILSHILPILISALISIAALEMGAVLMLLGELGFIGIFMGGGAFAELAWLAPPYHYSDVPEWGALLSNVRTYARAYPWMALYPSLAFFTAILAFNLFGEGMRRLVDNVGIGITRLVNRYTVALALLAILGTGWVRGNTGAAAVYRQQASAFDGKQALAHVQALSDSALEGQALGTPGMDATATYIAGQFKDLGLQAAGEDSSYFQTRTRAYESLDAAPQLIIEDNGPPLAYRQEYVEYPGRNRILGQIRGRVRLVTMGELSSGQWGDYHLLKDKDFSHDILIVLSEQDISYLERVHCGALLVVADEGMELSRRNTLSAREPIGDRYMPMLWINETTANRLLSGTGHTLGDLRRMADELGRDEMINLPTQAIVSIEVRSAVHEEVPVYHVIGHLPGRAASIEGAPIAEAAKLDDHLIVILAQYDNPPCAPAGTPCPAANDNASGVAVMLEAINTMQETGYQPYKTFLFIAYSGEGQEDGINVPRPEVSQFLQAKQGFADSFEIEAVVELRGLGAGQGDGLILSAGGSKRLADLSETSAQRMDVRVSRAREPLDISIIFEDKSFSEGGQEAPNIQLSWEGWEATSRLPTDTLDTISQDKLEQSGRALALTLMTLGRETQY